MGVGWMEHRGSRRSRERRKGNWYAKFKKKCFSKIEKKESEKKMKQCVLFCPCPLKSLVFFFLLQLLRNNQITTRQINTIPETTQKKTQFHYRTERICIFSKPFISKPGLPITGYSNNTIQTRSYKLTHHFIPFFLPSFLFSSVFFFL